MDIPANRFLVGENNMLILNILPLGRGCQVGDSTMIFSKRVEIIPFLKTTVFQILIGALEKKQVAVQTDNDIILDFQSAEGFSIVHA
jgi:hypothetical protein